jgi:hypothetical protein
MMMIIIIIIITIRRLKKLAFRFITAALLKIQLKLPHAVVSITIIRNARSYRVTSQKTGIF